jgi:hypothetical protein
LLFIAGILMTKKKDTKFKPKTSGNKGGRPPGATNKLPSDKALKEGFKKYGIEAVNNIARYMRKYQQQAELATLSVLELEVKVSEVSRGIENLKQDIHQDLGSEVTKKDLEDAFSGDSRLKLEEDTLSDLHTALERQERREVKAIENMYKASCKIVEVADKVVSHDDKLSVDKSKKGIPATVSDEEGKTDTPAPVVSLTAVKPLNKQ